MNSGVKHNHGIQGQNKPIVSTTTSSSSSSNQQEHIASSSSQAAGDKGGTPSDVSSDDTTPQHQSGTAAGTAGNNEHTSNDDKIPSTGNEKPASGGNTSGDGSSHPQQQPSTSTSGNLASHHQHNQQQPNPDTGATSSAGGQKDEPTKDTPAGTTNTGSTSVGADTNNSGSDQLPSKATGQQQHHHQEISFLPSRQESDGVEQPMFNRPPPMIHHALTQERGFDFPVNGIPGSTTSGRSNFADSNRQSNGNLGGEIPDESLVGGIGGQTVEPPSSDAVSGAFSNGTSANGLPIGAVVACVGILVAFVGIFGVIYRRKKMGDGIGLVSTSGRSLGKRRGSDYSVGSTSSASSGGSTAIETNNMPLPSNLLPPLKFAPSSHGARSSHRGARRTSLPPLNTLVIFQANVTNDDTGSAFVFGGEKDDGYGVPHTTEGFLKPPTFAVTKQQESSSSSSDKISTTTTREQHTSGSFEDTNSLPYLARAYTAYHERSSLYTQNEVDCEADTDVDYQDDDNIKVARYSANPSLKSVYSADQIQGCNPRNSIYSLTSESDLSEFETPR